MSCLNTNGSRRIFSVWITLIRDEQSVKRVSSFVSLVLFFQSSNQILISALPNLQDDRLALALYSCLAFFPPRIPLTSLHLLVPAPLLRHLPQPNRSASFRFLLLSTTLLSESAQLVSFVLSIFVL